MPYTIATIVSSEQEVKKSRFHGFAVPVKNEQEVKDFLLQHKDPTAHHQCWAWKIGHDVRFHDAGEPGGTAGRPILAAIEGNDLTDVLVMVNRWFGGIKLGTGGLARAYGSCAGQTLLLAEKIPLLHYRQVVLHCYFNEWAKLHYYLQQHDMSVTEQYQTDGIVAEVKLLQHQYDDLAHYLQDLTRGREQLTMIEPDAL